MMIEHRNRISGGSRIPWLKKMVLFFYQGVVLRKLLWLPRLLARTPLKKKLSLPAFQPADLKRIAGGDREREYDVLLFPGCVFTYFYPRKIVEIKSLLEKQGFSVLYPDGLHCCGFPYLSQGWGKEIRLPEKKEPGAIQALPLQTDRRALLDRGAGLQKILRPARGSRSSNWASSFTSSALTPPSTRPSPDKSRAPSPTTTPATTSSR